jgi:hypothetical protein
MRRFAEKSTLPRQAKKFESRNKKKQDTKQSKRNNNRNLLDNTTQTLLIGKRKYRIGNKGVVKVACFSFLLQSFLLVLFLEFFLSCSSI